MNYLRGAVNAISAPYQYYKELPPINPSTLTGAIDVIVIQGPSAAGDTELACSPFHVRFGKWQVLRPSDKKVTISVNGKPIPYYMKIGDAGEAFFVFETDEDVPPDLITSPILEPTMPEEEASDAQLDATVGLLGNVDHPPSDASASEEAPKPLPEVESEQEVHDDSQEPEFLDLNASSSNVRLPKPVDGSRHDANGTPAQRSQQPSFLRHSASQSTIQRHPSPKQIFRRTDEIVKDLGSNAKAPEVEYHHNVALDSQGYNTHVRESSDKTVHPSSPAKFQFPSLKTPPRISAAMREAQTAIHSTASSDAESDSEDESYPSSNHRRLRATSEPPPELDDHLRPPTDSEFLFDDDQDTPTISEPKFTHGLKIDFRPPTSPSRIQEYSWEWGAFPTPSPVRTVFGKGGRFESWKKKEDEDEDMLAGAYVTISAKNEDDTALFLTINRRTLDFQLSLVLGLESYLNGNQREEGVIEVSQIQSGDEFGRRFEEGKITFSRFMQDDSIHKNPALVVKWVDGHFVSLYDNPLLFEALASWRTNTLNSGSREGENEVPVDTTRHSKSKSEPPTPEQKAAAEAEELRDGADKKPGSLSWVQWWSRNRQRNTVDVVPVTPVERPVLRPAVTEPPPGTAKAQLFMLDKASLKELSRQKVMKDPEADSAFPSTPSDLTLNEEAAPQVSPTLVAEQQPRPVRKFVKTLRLTSDQLKALDLKPGANVITFSISSGVIACTSRIFVWDYMDHVVVSDIDGTITKSDGLGHVFAMIGRDWTHVGVAKLYTDIVKNGYKIMYLTSRAIGQADATRGYLKGIKQDDYQLPEGPVIMSPDRLIASLHREVIMRKPEVFKMACLRDIQRLFGEHSKNPFYAGFGNRITDALSYRSVNVPSARIFTIDSTGVVKMELLELAGYESSYIHMTDLVDQMFPPINKKWAPEYTDLTYWKTPVPDYPPPDLAPPSPTLSALSETSNQSTLAKIRNFRLIGGSRANSLSSPPNELANGVNSSQGSNNAGLSNDPEREFELRQMSSFERLVKGLRRSVSPSSTSSRAAESDSESEVDVPQDRRRPRRRSMTSMPGSLDDMQFGIDEDQSDDGEDEDEDEDDKDSEGEYEHEEGEMDEDLTMDEDLLAATEMQKIPFL